MNLNDRSLSLQFYKYLCNIVGSEEVVRTRRDIFSAKDIVANTIDTTFISSGSKAEGLDLKGSDYDIMLLANFLLVYESLNNVQYDLGDTILFIDTNDTTPGFTKLKLASKSGLYNDLIHNWSETVGNETYISSKLFRETDVPDDMIIHGPCRSSVDGQVDRVGCFRCKEWITPAQQWIHRSRTAWPDSMLVTAAVQYGVLFVPIGCKDSPNENLQWRISFSVTEKLLICSFSHTQLLCYALMKIILKDLIKPKHGDLLCSYFLKTIMFWLSEEMNPSEWKPENMISCFLDCIRRLTYYVEYKTCLHYFIPTNNLFENRFTDREHEELLNTLRCIYESPLISVFETSTFQNYRLESHNSRGMILSASELPCYIYLKEYRRNNSESIYSANKHLVNVCLPKELRTYIFSLDARKLLQSSHHCNMMDRNKLFYQQYKRTLCYLKISLRSESITPWLLLASLFYKCKRYLECLDIINCGIPSFSPKKILLHPANSLAEQTEFNEMKQKCGLINAFKHLVIDNVCFRNPYGLLPDEMGHLKFDRDPIQISQDKYCYLLQIFCCYQLGDDRAAQNALHDFELTNK